MMMPTDLEKRVFLSTPKVIPFKGKQYKVAVEKARYAEIEKMLKVCPVAVSINIFGDRDRGRGHTPTNMFNRQYNKMKRDSIYYEFIMRMAATMSVNIHVADTDSFDCGALLEQAVRYYLGWTMWDLRDTGIEIPGQVGGVTDFSYLDRGIMRQQFDVPIGYQFTLPLKEVEIIRFLEGTFKFDTEDSGPYWSAEIAADKTY